jgi:hypothetical protein
LCWLGKDKTPAGHAGQTSAKTQMNRSSIELHLRSSAFICGLNKDATTQAKREI